MDLLLLGLAAVGWLAGAALFGLTAYSLALFAYGRSIPDPPLHEGGGSPAVTALVASLAASPALSVTLRRLAEVDYPSLDVAVALGPSATPFTAGGGSVKLLPAVAAKGKAQALNAAIGEVRSPYILLLDEDSLVDHDCVRRLLPLAEDPGTWAVVGVPYASNADAGPLQRTLDLEAEAWASTARARDRLGLFLPATGFFSLVSRASLDADAGAPVWHADALAEDADLSLRQLARGRRARLSTAKVGIEAPGTLRALAGQRLRWYKGMLDALWTNRAAVAGLRPALAADAALSLLTPLAPAGFVVLLLLSPLWPSVLLPVLLGAALVYSVSAWLSASKLGRGRAGVVLLSLPYALVQGGVALGALGAFLLHVRVGWRRTEKSGDALQHDRFR